MEVRTPRSGVGYKGPGHTGFTGLLITCNGTDIPGQGTERRSSIVPNRRQSGSSQYHVILRLLHVVRYLTARNYQLF